MDLLLWRHAEAEDGSPDAERALTPKGQRQAEALAQWLSHHRPKHLRILVSPALRTRQTVAPFARHFETETRVGTGADYHELLVAAGWPDGGGAVLVVGHQPTLGRTAAFLLAGTPVEWTVKKGALWWLQARPRDGGHQVVLKAVLGPEFCGAP